MRCLVSGVGLWWWSTPWFTCLQYWSGFGWILWHSLSPSQHQCMYNTIEVHTMYMYNLQHVWITRIYIATTSKRALIMLSCWNIARGPVMYEVSQLRDFREMVSFNGGNAPPQNEALLSGWSNDQLKSSQNTYLLHAEHCQCCIGSVTTVTCTFSTLCTAWGQPLTEDNELLCLYHLLDVVNCTLKVLKQAVQAE